MAKHKQRASEPVSEPVEDQLRDFEAESSTLPAPPKNLGNFPDELDRGTQPLRAEREPEDVPPPVTEPEPTEAAPVTEPEPEEPRDQAAQPEPDTDDELARLRRENEFLRLARDTQAPPPAAAQQPPPDVTQLIGQYLGGYKVRPEDVQTILSDPEKGAEYLTAGIYAAVAAGAAMAVDRARAEFNQYQGQQQSATQLRDLFYREHADLAPYGKLVQQCAGEVYAEANATGRRLDAHALVRESAQRVRTQLREWGVTPQRAAGTPAPVRRLQPARGEMGGAGRPNGKTTLSPLEKQLREFEAGTNQFR